MDQMNPGANPWRASESQGFSAFAVQKFCSARSSLETVHQAAIISYQLVMNSVGDGLTDQCCLPCCSGLSPPRSDHCWTSTGCGITTANHPRVVLPAGPLTPQGLLFLMHAPESHHATRKNPVLGPVWKENCIFQVINLHGLVPWEAQQIKPNHWDTTTQQLGRNCQH